MKAIGIIPARFNSIRFPGKPLIDIHGKTMVQRVYQQAKKASTLDEVIVATDDERIHNHVLSFNGKVVMTGEHHISGTDRCLEAFMASNSNADIVVNIQGDEPFIDPGQINHLVTAFNDVEVDIATLAMRFADHENIHDNNKVKVVMNEKNQALYFSRSPIPAQKRVPVNEWQQHANYYRHIGIYAYRSKVLAEITMLTPTMLEKIESLEQLRWLENGFKINVQETTFETPNIDSPDDLIHLNQWLDQHPEFE